MPVKKKVSSEVHVKKKTSAEAELDRPVKKSELLRAGIRQLTLMTDAQLMAAIVALPIIKTGRPKKQEPI